MGVGAPIPFPARLSQNGDLFTKPFCQEYWSKKCFFLVVSVPASFSSDGFAPSSRKVDSLHYCKPKVLHKKHCCSVFCATKLHATHDGLSIINSDLNAVVESISCSSAGPFLARLTLQWCPYCSKDPEAPQPTPTPRGSTTYCQSNTSSMPAQFQAPGTPVLITMQRSCSITAVPTHTQKHSEPKKPTKAPKPQNHQTWYQMWESLLSSVVRATVHP